MPEISIITPTYNSEKTIGGTINALLRQSFSDFEYIIIDGLSKDNTVAKIKSYITAFEQKGISVRIVSEKDSGVYDAMNKGVSMAKGKLIGITNSDDWYEDHALEVMWNMFSQVKNQSNTMLYGIERVWKGEHVYNVQRRGATYISEGSMPHSTFFVSKDVYEKFGAFDLSVRILADYDFICRCVSKGVELIEVDEIVSNFRLGGISSSYFDYYKDLHTIQHKYGFISHSQYKQHLRSLQVKKIINRFINRW